jgi:hypothetical protein
MPRDQFVNSGRGSLGFSGYADFMNGLKGFFGVPKVSTGKQGQHAISATLLANAQKNADTGANWTDGWEKVAIIGGVAVATALATGGTSIAGAGLAGLAGIMAGVTTQGAFKENAELQTGAGLLDTQANLEETAANIAWESTKREKANAAAQQGIAVKGANEDSRVAAISSFQQGSAGEAALAQSGASGGTAYMSLESSLGETQRKIREWFKNTSESTGLNSGMIGSGSEAAKVNYMASDLNVSILRKNADKLRNEASPYNLALNILGKNMSLFQNMFDITTNAGALAKASGINLDSFDLLGNTYNVNKQLFGEGIFSDLMKTGTAYKFAQLTGTGLGNTKRDSPLNFMSGFKRTEDF